jgi:murein DD-endopeptidase MepM/ murein hydrolase activator NlpD
MEVPYRLKVSPIQHYEQITALLKDRPNHHGMDFKAPIGTPTVSTRDGTIVRTNWNTHANGGCVEIRYPDGVKAKYLHLSEVRVRPGDQVRSGEVVGLSGNTGRSTAPHLHYQLDRSEKILDPIDYHGKQRRQLGQADVQQLQEAAARLDSVLGQAVAKR